MCNQALILYHLLTENVEHSKFLLKIDNGLSYEYHLIGEGAIVRKKDFNNAVYLTNIGQNDLHIMLRSNLSYQITADEILKSIKAIEGGIKVCMLCTDE